MSNAVRFSEFGSADVLRIVNVPDVEPGAGEVAIKVGAIGLNWADALWRQNMYVEPVTLPAGLGNEAAGEIVAIGEGVVDLKVGDKVVVLPGIGQGRYPTYGERILAPSSHTVRYAKGLSVEQAASYYVAYLTGYFAMYEMAKLERGDSILITGASSGTGQAAIQMAAESGILAIATTRSARKRQSLIDAGADHVIVTDEEDLVSRIDEITGGLGVNLVYDGVGGRQFESLGDVVAHRGWIILYGVSGGADFKFPVYSQFEKSWRFHTYKNAEFTGSESMGLQRDEAALRRSLEFVNRGFTSGAFTLPIDRVFPLDDVIAAHKYLEAADHVGKVVLKV